jgi:hypothetical protein
MPLLILVLLAALPAQESAPDFRRSLALVNRDDQPLAAGIQVVVSSIMSRRLVDGADASDVQIFHGGKRIPSWSRGSEVWFRLAAPIPPRGRDLTYEVRYGGGKAASRPEEVFEFFEGFTAPLDPLKWRADPDLGVRQGEKGLEIIRIPAGRNEYAPASLIPRVSLPAGFVFEADMAWEFEPGSSASFALGANLERRAPSPELVAQGAAMIKKLGEDDISVREEAIRDLVKLGLPAVPALEEVAGSADPEMRQRAAQIISRIMEIEAPPVIRTGLSPGADGRLDRVDLLGRSRTVLKRSYERQAAGTLSISRAEDGETTLSWTRRRPVVVPGKVERIRLDFWSGAGPSPGMIRLSRVSVRRHVDLQPHAEVGDEIPIR